MAYTPKNKTIPVPIRERIVALWAQGEFLQKLAYRTEQRRTL